MKICYLIPEWPAQSHVWAWREISHLREFGLEVDIFATRRPSELGKHGFVDAALAQTCFLWPLSILAIVKSIAWGIASKPKGFIECIKLAMSLPVDRRPSWRFLLPLIVPACRLAQEVESRHIRHLHTPIPGNCAILCMFVKRLTGVPFSLTVVAAFEDWGGAMKEKMADASFVTLVAQWMINQVRDEFPDIPNSHYSITRHGVDTAKWKPSSLRSAAIPGPTRILSIGRLAFNKGFDVLVRAAAELKERGLSFQVRIVGSGPDRARIESLIQGLGVTEDVHLLGALGEEECLSECQAADIFVLASHKEPLGVVYLEAMAVEVATIGTAAGGVVEIIASEENGLLVPPGQVSELADAVERLLLDEDLRRKLAIAGRKTVLEKFDSRIGARKLQSLIIETSCVS